jgi:hypothetical protein
MVDPSRLGPSLRSLRRTSEAAGCASERGRGCQRNSSEPASGPGQTAAVRPARPARSLASQGGATGTDSNRGGYEGRARGNVARFESLNRLYVGRILPELSLRIKAYKLQPIRAALTLSSDRWKTKPLGIIQFTVSVVLFSSCRRWRYIHGQV